MSQADDLNAACNAIDEQTAKIRAIAKSMGGGTPVPTPIPPNPTPTPPGNALGPIVRQQVFPPGGYTAPVQTFSFYGGSGVNGTDIVTAYSPGFGPFPGDRVSLAITELDGTPVASEGPFSNPNSQGGITTKKTVPGKLYLLTVRRDQPGGQYVQQN
jgi:hypothetical protein